MDVFKLLQSKVYFLRAMSRVHNMHKCGYILPCVVSHTCHIDGVLSLPLSRLQCLNRERRCCLEASGTVWVARSTNPPSSAMPVIK